MRRAQAGPSDWQSEAAIPRAQRPPGPTGTTALMARHLPQPGGSVGGGGGTAARHRCVQFAGTCPVASGSLHENSTDIQAPWHCRESGNG